MQLRRASETKASLSYIYPLFSVVLILSNTQVLYESSAVLKVFQAICDILGDNLLF